jgi:hypothetical protein
VSVAKTLDEFNWTATVTARGTDSQHARRARDGESTWPPVGPRNGPTRGLFLATETALPGPHLLQS